MGDYGQLALQRLENNMVEFDNKNNPGCTLSRIPFFLLFFFLLLFYFAFVSLFSSFSRLNLVETGGRSYIILLRYYCDTGQIWNEWGTF